MDKLIDLEDLLQNVRDGNVAVRVIGFAGFHQQADPQEMGQALAFVSGCLDKILDQANEIFEEIRSAL